MRKLGAGKRVALLLIVMLLMAVIPPSAAVSEITATGIAWDLASLFSTESRVFLLDQNEDGLTDALNTAIVLPAKPSTTEAAAAAEIAARLGFETMGMNHRVAMTDAEAAEVALTNPVLIGRGNQLVKAAEEGSQNKLEPLDPRQGAIQLAPGVLGTNAVLLGGVDDAGTLAAAEYLAARLPFVWQVGQGNPTLRDVAAAAAGYAGADPGAASITRIVVAQGNGGLAQVFVQIAAADQKQAVAMHKAFQQLSAAHEEGAQWDKLNYERIGLLAVEVSYEGQTLKTLLPNSTGLPDATPPAPSAAEPDSFDLSSLYGNWDEVAPEAGGPISKIEGLLQDTPEDKPFLQNVGVLDKPVKDFTPDETKATIVAEGSGAAATGAANFAARLGLETTGLSLPLAQTPEGIADASKVVNPVLFGAENPLVQQLRAAGKIDLSALRAGQGLVSVVPKAFGSYDAVVVAGKDEAGTAAAAEYAARRLPYLWAIGRGNATVAGAEDAAKDFFALESAAGQAAAAVLKVDEMTAGLSGSPTIDLAVYLEEESPQFAAFLKNRLEAKLPGATANVVVKAAKAPANVFTTEWSDPGEVADFWSTFSALEAAVGDGTNAEIEVRLSEPPEELNAIEASLKAKAPNAKVTVISAYKQGFSWLERVVGPAIKGRPVDKAKISFEEFYQDGVNASNWKFWQSAWTDPVNNWMDLPTRWLQEMYPIDDVWQSTGVVGSRDQVVFDRVVKSDPNVPLAGPVYRVEVTFTDGSPAYTAEFSPTYAERNYHTGDTTVKNFKVHPTTGWVKIAKAGTTLADQRIRTDPERYWDYFQNTLWPATRDYVQSVTGGKPTFDKQPFFREIRHEVYMSEPNYRLNVREEMISSLEALHEDIYFVTLDYFATLAGARYPNRYVAPGRIAPWIRDGAPGSAPRATITLDALSAREPKVVMQVDGATTEAALSGASVGRPSATTAVVGAGADTVARLVVGTQADDAAAQVKAADMLEALGAIHAAGAFTEQLSWAKLDELAVQVGGPLAPAIAALPTVATGPAEKVIGPTTGVTLPGGDSIVRWDGPIGYEEVNAILAELDKTPEVNVWLGAKSYLGQNVYVADAMLPIQGELWSQAKASTWKPTFMIIARQHANEVSSTNSGLRLLEQMTKDPAFREYLKRLNVTFVPYENADGATFGYELQKEQPTWMHHAARYNGTGTDIGGYSFNATTPYGEALVRTKTWETWLPDIAVNDHGFPSHEWVQQFAGYTPPGYATYWIPRATFYGYLSYMAKRVPGSTSVPIPEGKAVSDALRAEVYAELKTQPDVMANIQDWKNRYYKYGNQWMPNVFPVEYYGDPGQEVLIYYDPSNVNPLANSYSSGYPWITTLFWTTEIADETSQGAYMDMTARSHFYPDIAQMNVLRDADLNLDRSAADVDGGVYLRVSRQRPVTP